VLMGYSNLGYNRPKIEPNDIEKISCSYINCLDRLGRAVLNSANESISMPSRDIASSVELHSKVEGCE
jgi:hypothetical protein